MLGAGTRRPSADYSRLVPRVGAGGHGDAHGVPGARAGSVPAPAGAPSPCLALGAALLPRANTPRLLGVDTIPSIRVPPLADA